MRPILQTRAGKARTLAQQQSDFTAEGSPPPGHAAAPVPPETDLPPPAQAPSAREGKTPADGS